LTLQFGFPGSGTATVTPAGIGQDEQLPAAAVAVRAVALPPAGDGVGGKGCRVVRDTYEDRASVGEQVIDPIGDLDADGIGAEESVPFERFPGLPESRTTARPLPRFCPEVLGFCCLLLPFRGFSFRFIFGLFGIDPTRLTTRGTPRKAGLSGTFRVSDLLWRQRPMVFTPEGFGAPLRLRIERGDLGMGIWSARRFAPGRQYRR
jgi:hypothetical protein